MAIIGTIRDRGRFLLLGIVGLALVLFIAGNFFDAMGGPGDRGNYGTIDGEEVDPTLYDKNVEIAVTQDSQQAAQGQQEYGDRERQQSEARAWQITVDELVLQREYDELGISVSDREFNAYLFGEEGFTLLPDIQQNFTDPATGKLRKADFQKMLAERDKATDPVQKKQWEDTKDQLRKARQQEKYFQLLQQGVYVTKLEAKQDYVAKNEHKSVSFVVRNFRDIPDEDVKIKESEIKAFYEANKDKKKYEVLAGRDVKYFDIMIEPSRADIKKFNLEMAQYKSGFASATNDSLYVMQNSDFKFYMNDHRATFRPQGDPKAREFTYPAAMDTIFKTASIGQIVGPYEDNGKMRLAKVIDFNTKVCKVRHILISAPKGDAAKIASAKKLSDSLVKVVNKKNFEEFVVKYSEDPGSKDKGGVYEDFMDYEMVPEFSKFSTDKAIGTIGVVQTDFGFHIIEVLDRKEVKYPILAIIEKTLVPSDQTENDINAKATNLLYKINQKLASKSDLVAKLNLFDTIAKKEGYFARPVKMMDEAPRATGFNTPAAEQKILELAYQSGTEVGTVCGSPILDKDRYIIAVVSSIREKGAPEYHDCYMQMRMEAIKEKKANRFKKQIGTSKNLEQIAKKGNTTVMTADITFANPSIQGAGYEPEIVGQIFTMGDKKTSLPLVGNAGVYVIRVIKTIKAPAVKNYDNERLQLLAQAKGQVQGSARSALMKMLDVKDNRALLQLGIARD